MKEKVDMLSKIVNEFKILYKREKFLVISNLSIITVTFLILSFFLTLVVGMQSAISTLEKQAQITIFFKDEYTEENILSLKNTLEQDERVLSVNYVSKLDAYQIFTELNKNEPILLEAASEDVFPASLEIRTKELVSLSELSSEYESNEGVEEIKFFKDVVERFRFWRNIVYVVGGLIGMVFLVLSFAIVFATLRISIGSKEEEIEIMQLVGASDEYIRSPFIYQGLSFGIVSVLFTTILIGIVSTTFHFLNFINLESKATIVPGLQVAVWGYLLILVGLLMIFGFCLSYFGSRVAVKRFLKS